MVIHRDYHFSEIFEMVIEFSAELSRELLAYKIALSCRKRVAAVVCRLIDVRSVNPASGVGVLPESIETSTPTPGFPSAYGAGVNLILLVLAAPFADHHRMQLVLTGDLVKAPAAINFR
jgi:hypothetical protein